MRRIVTGHDSAGKSIVVSDSEPARVEEPVPGVKLIELWATEGAPLVGEAAETAEDPTVAMESFTPPIGGSRFRLFTIPPLDTDDPEVAGKLRAAIEANAARIPGLGERLELEDPGMHTTDTVDYIIILAGEADLELDDGLTVHVRPGDTVVQCGTRHAWRNRGKETFLAAAVMVGARRSGKTSLGNADPPGN